ncbi:hypothetical protein [Streptococcus suis]|uniref:Uncharacterized protein n=1 Tax=Streptococcus suis R61 TaxID=996306 RepID=A0AA87F8B4_STRSU|nr:hypothetical protein [Streptococcus suis]ATZ02606.1 hypothetical protein CVO91_00750 [Streptococcus suis]EHC02721.1 hypothetical protein SSUR61_1468 [Streptococcus suis R61]MBY5002332.1 hypothetical protein [Streptococcus suis]MBY5013399.1 hypothetical protein [Streptococcus suis]MBY5020212.1 hypothetical protein [Streptococcus suis]
MLTINAKKICDAVVHDWVSDFNELDDQFKINLSRRDFYHKTYPILGNKTFYNYLKDALKLVGKNSRYTYPSFKRKAEILISNGLIQNLKFNSIDSLTLDNALSKIVNISLKIEDFEDDNGNFNFELWFEFLLNHNRIEVTEDIDDILFFLILTYLNNIIQFYGVLPYFIKVSVEDDSLHFYCIDFTKEETTFFVSVTNPLASHFY